MGIINYVEKVYPNSFKVFHYLKECDNKSGLRYVINKSDVCNECLISINKLINIMDTFVVKGLIELEDKGNEYHYSFLNFNINENISKKSSLKNVNCNAILNMIKKNNPNILIPLNKIGVLRDLKNILEHINGKKELLEEFIEKINYESTKCKSVLEVIRNIKAYTR